MGDMKTPDFDDLLAAFDIPDPTSLDAKEAIQATNDEGESHLKPAAMCIDENLNLSHAVPISDIPVVSVIVKNTSRQESFEADKEANHLNPVLLHNGFRGSDLSSEPHNIGHSYGKFDSAFINGDSSRNYDEKVDKQKSEPLPSFSQFSPISSPEPEDQVKDNGIVKKQKQAENLYFPPPMYIPSDVSDLDTQRKPAEHELSMFDQYCKKEQKQDNLNKETCLEGTTSEQDRTAVNSEDSGKSVAKANSFLGASSSFGELPANNAGEHKAILSKTNAFSSVPPRQRLKPAHSKLSSCVAALVALQAKKVATVPKEELPADKREHLLPIKEEVMGSPKMPKSPKSPRSPLEVMKKINKPPDSPMSVCSDTSSKDSPSVGAGSPPAIPKVRIKTIKTSSGQIKRTVTRILPELDSDGLVKSPEGYLSESSNYDEPAIKNETNVEAVLQDEKQTVLVQSADPSLTSVPSTVVVSLPTGSVKSEDSTATQTNVNSTLHNPGSNVEKADDEIPQENKKQPLHIAAKSPSTPTNLLPKAVHLANLNLVPNSISVAVAAKTIVPKRGQSQQTQMSMPLVHQVKKAAPVIVEAFTKLLHSANPVPVYTPNLNPPFESSIRVPASGYSCLECGDSFALEKSLTQHYNRRSVHIEVMCTQCSKMVLFYNKCSLLGHAREHKSKGFIMQCSQLLMKPIASDQMFAPTVMSSLSLPPQPSCLTPNLQAVSSRPTTPASGSTTPSQTAIFPPAMPLYTDPVRLIRHAPKCHECNKLVHDYVSMASHYQRTSEDNDGLTCQVCQMMLPNKCSYTAHQRIHAHKSPYCCPECGALCRSAYFQTHVKENCLHYSRKVGFRCSHCGVVFMTLGMLKDHIQEKHCEVFHKCSFCPMAFKSTENTTTHMTAQHPTVPAKAAQVIYKCSCETVFNRKKLLHQHFYQNTNKLLVCVFKCPECQLVYMQKPLLMQHVKGVHGVPSNPEDISSFRKKTDTTSNNRDSGETVETSTTKLNTVAKGTPGPKSTTKPTSTPKSSTSTKSTATLKSMLTPKSSPTSKISTQKEMTASKRTATQKETAASKDLTLPKERSLAGPGSPMDTSRPIETASSKGVTLMGTETLLENASLKETAAVHKETVSTKVTTAQKQTQPPKRTSDSKGSLNPKGLSATKETVPKTLTMPKETSSHKAASTPKSASVLKSASGSKSASAVKSKPAAKSASASKSTATSKSTPASKTAPALKSTPAPKSAPPSKSSALKSSNPKSTPDSKSKPSPKATSKRTLNPKQISPTKQTLTSKSVPKADELLNGTSNTTVDDGKIVLNDTKSLEAKTRWKSAGWTCMECSEMVPDRETYVFHMKKSHGKCMKRYPCRHCERSFNSSVILRRHVRNSHDTSKNVYTCSYCTEEKQTFVKAYMLENHISLMHGIKNPDVTQMSNPELAEKITDKDPAEVIVPTSKRIAQDALSETDSLDVPEAPPAKKPKLHYKCAKCGFATGTESQFLEHIPQHKTDNSTFQCLHCGLCYTSQISLNRHLFIVHKVKESEDLEDEKSQDTESVENSGHNVHNMEAESVPDENGKWPCKLCDKTFDTDIEHGAHVRTHDSSTIKFNGGAE